MELSSSEYFISNGFVQAYRPQYSLIVALSAALLVSTGTRLSFTNASDFSSVENVPLITIVQHEKSAKEVAVAHHELLLHIRDSFKMSMTELAGVLNVSRAALYAWFQGSTPRHDLRDRLWQLKQYADAIAALNIDRLDLLIKVPLSGGTSILQALSADKGVQGAIDELSALAKSRAASIEQLRNKPLAAKVHAVEEITSAFNDFV